ncbi:MULTISPECIES: nuclear transport factor 2 family protein [unclassified Flavobacterium]|uniref:YybH family protein n=1 Tax=unclassified Flavobacterium TaxID=196869 RepID=UPI001F130D16|nr:MULTISPECIES: nuclear transport factor 2 family protein [unclassified Flavobacterium]UMY65098.1 nuclear transport factor 2 family protein [Flavobacterium sp. HJ-32-4]
MMTTAAAEAFAHEWIEAWNSHDLDRILAHYDDDLTFYSPFIPLLKFNEEGVIRSKTELAAYFRVGLDTYPDLFFAYRHCFVGVHSLVLYYVSVNGRLAAEVFELNEHGRATRVLCHYAS